MVLSKGRLDPWGMMKYFGIRRFDVMGVKLASRKPPSAVIQPLHQPKWYFLGRPHINSVLVVSNDRYSVSRRNMRSTRPNIHVAEGTPFSCYSEAPINHYRITIKFSDTIGEGHKMMFVGFSTLEQPPSREHRCYLVNTRGGVAMTRIGAGDA
jgi:hypothetical protein